jgi:hypothetical protein
MPLGKAVTSYSTSAGETLVGELCTYKVGRKPTTNLQVWIHTHLVR